jgi:hypothetical protein
MEKRPDKDGYSFVSTPIGNELNKKRRRVVSTPTSDDRQLTTKERPQPVSSEGEVHLAKISASDNIIVGLES